MADRKSMGRGLSSLLDEIADDSVASTVPNGTVTEAKQVAIDLIEPYVDQPRKKFVDEELEELAQSIRENGILQPLLVRPHKDREGIFEIVAGERRWRAAQKAKLDDVPVIVLELSDERALEIAIIENVQRSDLNALEEAEGYQTLIRTYSYTQDQLSKRVGKSRSHVANLLRLANLPIEIQDQMRAGKLSAGHGRALLTADQPEELAREVIAKGLSVRETEARAGRKQPADKSAVQKSAQVRDANTLVLEGELSAALRMTVEVRQTGSDSGEVRISYRTLEDLDDLVSILKREN